MRKIGFLIILLIASFALAKEIQQKTLNNGMQIVVKENDLNESVGLYCFVKTGSVNEGKYLGAGISHYLEHVVSSGTTTKHTEDEYNAMGKEMGALVNAYTTQFATAYYITVDKVYTDNALLAISEQMQFCTCDSFEVAREREVILKEIVMRSTPARSKIHQRNSELVYPNSNKRYPVIGYTELFKTITRDELEDYYKKRYSPNNMIFVAVGNFESTKMMKKIEKAFQDFPRRQLEPVYQPTQNLREGSLEYIEEFEIKQPEMQITSLLPADDYSDTTALNSALNILFGKRKSPIRYKLVEELELVTKIYAYAYGRPNSSEGEIVISFTPKSTKNVKKIVEIIDEEIEKYSQSGIAEAQLANLINRIKAQKLLHTPGVSSDANRIGWNMIAYNIPDTYFSELNKLESLTIEDLKYQLQKHLLAKNRVIFYALPKGEKKLLERSDEIAAKKTDIRKEQINKDLTLLHKMNTEKPMIKGVIHLPISSNYETKENDGSLSFMLKMMFKSTKKFKSLDISEWMEDHVVSLDTNCRKNGSLIQFKCLKADYPHLKEILVDAFNNPTFNKKDLELAKQNRIASFKKAQSRATTAQGDFRRSILFQDSRAGNSSENLKDIIISLTRDDLLELHEKYFKAKNIIVTLFGDLSLDEAKELAEDLQDNIPDGKIEDTKTFDQISKLDDTYINQYDFEQVNIEIATPAPPLNSKERVTMELIKTILSGARGRLHQAVRGKNNLAYYAFPRYANSENFGQFRLTSQTSIDKKDELIDVLKEQLNLLMREKVTIEEINSAAEEGEKMLRAMLNDNSLPYYITYYESIGLGFDYIDKITEISKKVTPAQIKDTANKYFSNKAIIVSEPNDEIELMVK